jgi:hypothetical protein
MRSSIMLSLILLLPDWTTNTSFSRILVKILTLVSPCAHQPCCVEEFGSTYICELGQLHSSRSHAQIRAYLSREHGARAPSKYEGVAHRESVLGNVRKRRELENFKGPPSANLKFTTSAHELECHKQQTHASKVVLRVPRSQWGFPI